MTIRRTASADFRPLQGPQPPSSSTYSTPQDAVYTTSGSSFGQYRKANRSSSPARLQGGAEQTGQLPLRPVAPRNQRPASPRQHRSTQHARRSGSHSCSPLAKTSSSPRPHQRREKSDCLWVASVDPPVTKETLSELDLNRIVSDARLRHDLNFEIEIMFRPNTYGTRGETKKRDENLYFEALAIELEHYIRRQRSPPPSPSRPQRNSPTHMHRSATLSSAPPRLPPMLVAIREIVKTLVPSDKWQMVDEQFDVDLKMQELEHGICDIAALIDWLGNLLLCSCSPMRDPVVTAMVARTQKAIVTEDAQELMKAIRDLFGVLEIMKLDVANHQIRYLRFYLLEESIEYEQTQMLDRIATGWSISHERRWFENAYDNPQSHDRFLMFKESVIDMTVSPWDDFPLTFINDHDRLHALQYEFRLHHYGTACGCTLGATLRRLGWMGDPPAWSYAQCMQRVWAVAASQGEAFNLGPHPDVVLEIVRIAFKVCDTSELPDSGTLAFARLYLQEALHDNTTIHLKIKSKLRNGLVGLVHSEVTAISNMTPLEILHRYEPNPPGPSAGTHRDVNLLENIARRIAHVLVLHWRVWAPILYNQPDPAETTARQTIMVTEAEEMSERRRPCASDQSTHLSGSSAMRRPRHERRAKSGSLSSRSSATSAVSSHAEIQRRGS
ncbi:MAG: hypothetical protein Q9181_005937 [Wetmoreana brouardii]